MALKLKEKYQMKTNGFQIKQELKLLELSKDALGQELEGTYAKYVADNETRTPKQVLDELRKTEEKIALYQSAQGSYNQQNIVQLDGKQVPLAYVIKLDGVIGRMAKLWKDTSKQTALPSARYGIEKDQIYPVSQVSPKQCLEETKTLMTFATKLQGIIGVANAKEMSVEILDGITAR
jgi:hypothetical protein